MSKRFTDTDKWKKVWFSELTPKMKLVWFYLCDNCDHAGIWDINFRSVEFFTGVKCTLPKIIDAFGERIIVVDSKRLILSKFIRFQYGKLNPQNKCHSSVIKILEKYTLTENDLRGYVGAGQPLAKAYIGLKDKDKDKDKDKEKEKDKDSAIFDEIYQAYPSRAGNQGKKAGIDACKKKLRTTQEREDFTKAVNNYAEHCKKQSIIGTTYVKQWVNFIKGDIWVEWVNWKPGQAVTGQRNPFQLLQEEAERNELS